MNKYQTSLLILIAVVTLLSLPASSAQREEKQRAKKVQKEETTGKELSTQKVESNKVPEGAIVRGNAVTLKTGYKFVKQPGGSVVVEKRTTA